MKTIATLFSGGELFGVGARQAGYEHIYGIEYDDKIASVARLNGFNVITGDVRNTDAYKDLPSPDHLHASPPCPNFSVAKKGGGETEMDIELANAVCWFIVHKSPKTFSLENVTAYRKSQSLKMIVNTLEDQGYFIDIQNLNAANFGVPQTRKRLILRASKELLRPYPDPVKWVGWYEAIEDLIPTLPETQFAQWQLDRLPEEYKSFLIGQGTYSRAMGDDEPAHAITANSNQSGTKAFLVGGANRSKEQAAPGVGVSFDDEPTRVVAPNAGSWKAFLMESKFPGRNGKKFHKEPVPTVTALDPNLKAFVVPGGGGRDGGAKVRDGDDPMVTLRASVAAGATKAFVVNTKEPHGKVGKFTVKEEEEPLYTLLSSAGVDRHKAFIVEGQTGAGGTYMNVVDGEDPIWTIQASQDKKPMRAYTGRVVKMTVQALGRFQTVPDDYQGLTVKINGNGVPCLLARRIMESFP